MSFSKKVFGYKEVDVFYDKTSQQLFLTFKNKLPFSHELKLAKPEPGWPGLSLRLAGWAGLAWAWLRLAEG